MVTLAAVFVAEENAQVAKFFCWLIAKDRNKIGADTSMSAQAGVGILTSPRLSDCVSDWIPLGSRVCMLKLKVLDRSLCLLQVYAPNATSEYQAFVDEVNDALLRVSAAESTVLMGDFNAHVGTDTDTWKGMIGKHEVTGLNENGRNLLQLCCSNGLPHHEYLFPAQRGSQVYVVST